MIVGAASSWRFRAGPGSLGCRASVSLRCSLLVSHARAMPVEAAWAAAKTSGPLHAFFVRARAKHVAAEFLLFDDWFDAIEDSLRARVRGVHRDGAWRRNSPARCHVPATGGASRMDGEPALVVGLRRGHRKRGATGTWEGRRFPCRGPG